MITGEKSGIFSKNQGVTTIRPFLGKFSNITGINMYGKYNTTPTPPHNLLSLLQDIKFIIVLIKNAFKMAILFDSCEETNHHPRKKNMTDPVKKFKPFKEKTRLAVRKYT